MAIKVTWKNENGKVESLTASTGNIRAAKVDSSDNPTEKFYYEHNPAARAQLTERADEADKLTTPSASRMKAKTRVTSPMFRQQPTTQQNVVTPKNQNTLAQGLGKGALQRQEAKNYQSESAFNQHMQDVKPKTTMQRVGNTLKGAADDVKHVVSAGAKGSAGSYLGAAGLFNEINAAVGEAVGNLIGNPEKGKLWKEEAGKIAAGNYETGKRLTAEGQAEENLANYGKGPVGKFVNTLGVNTVQMGGDALLAPVAGGYSLIPLAVRAGGSAALESSDSGANLLRRAAYSVGTGGVEALTEKLSDGLAGIYGAGAADEIVEDVVAKLSKSVAGQAVLKTLFSATGEGLEEVISDFAQPALQTIYNGKSIGENYSAMQASDVLYDFLVGAALGGLGGGVEVAANRFARFDNSLGESGRKAIRGSYQEGKDTAEHVKDFIPAYNAGVEGKANPNPTNETAYAGYVAGQNDAKAEARKKTFAQESDGNSGLVYDDYVSREMDNATADEINTVAKALGVRVRMADEVMGGKANGVIEGNEIRIAKDAQDPVMQVVGHEWTHRVQELAPEQYAAFRNAIMEDPDVAEAANILHEQYNRMGVDTSMDEALDEAAANYAGEMIANTDVLNEFIRRRSEDRTLLEKLHDAIREIVGKLTGKAKQQAQTAEGLLQQAFEAAAQNSKNAAGEGGVRYSIEKTTDNKSFVEVDEDILDGVPKKDWVSTVKENLKNKFPDGITVGSNDIRIDKQSRQEMTFSGYMKWLYSHDPQLHSDKLRATNNADEILLATTDWVNEGLNHPRKDSISDFARGTVLLRVGTNDYTADVVVGTRKNGNMVLYDVLNLQPDSFVKKETDAVKAENPSPGADRNTASVSESSVSQTGENVNGDYSLKGTENAQEIAALKRENETLRQRVDYWKGQTRRSEGVRTDSRSVQQAAKKLVKDYGAEIDSSEIAGDLASLYDYIARGGDETGELTYTEARSRADAIAQRIAESAIAKDDEVYREYSELRKYLKDTKITLSAEDVAGITDYADLRRWLFGKVDIGKGEHTNVDQVYSELAESYPEFFSETRESNVSDQIGRIAEVANELYNVGEYNPFEGYMGQAVSAISNDIMERFFDLPQAKKTFADVQAEKLDAAKAAGRKAAADARLAGQMAQGRTDAVRLRHTQEALQKARTQQAEKLDALKTRYREKDATRREGQKRRELRAKITRHAKDLSKKLLRPTDTKHIPENMRSAVAAVLNSINQESAYTVDESGKRVYDGSGTPTQRTEAFRTLQEQYKAILKDNEGGDMVIDPSLLGTDGSDGLISQVVKMGDRRLSELTREELGTMWKTIRAVEKSVSTAGKVLSKSKFETTKQMADAFKTDVSTRRKKLGGNTTISLETPYTFFAHYGETGKSIYRMLRNAQDQQEVMARDIAEKTQKVLGDELGAAGFKDVAGKAIHGDLKGALRDARGSAIGKWEAETHDITVANGGKLTAATDLDVEYTNPEYHYNADADDAADHGAVSFEQAQAGTRSSARRRCHPAGDQERGDRQDEGAARHDAGLFDRG